MAKKENSGDRAYRDRAETEPSRQTGDINYRNNNTDNEEGLTAAEPDVERAENTGLGDKAENDRKLTSFTSNRSADA